MADELERLLEREDNKTRYSDGSLHTIDADNLSEKTTNANAVAMAVVEVVRDPNSTVREIHFSHNNTDPNMNMAYYTKEILREKKLTHLYLRHNNIGDEEARVITDMALDVDNPIKSIDLEHNNISENCFYELAEKISYANKYLVIYICEGYNSEGNQIGGTLLRVPL